jgi:multidrug efflux pump subunit AcrA (membrane-fusion protein)
LSLVLFPACRHSAPQQEQSIVINAPATGVVRTVLVEEGEGVDKDAVILQIAVPAEREVSPPANNKEQEREANAARLALVAAQDMASHTSSDVARIEPLVKSGLASQQELDKARMQAQNAQEQLRIAREKLDIAESKRNQTTPDASKEEILSVRAPAKGNVELSVQSGQRVSIGEAVAKVISRS